MSNATLNVLIDAAWLRSVGNAFAILISHRQIFTSQTFLATGKFNFSQLFLIVRGENELQA